MKQPMSVRSLLNTHKPPHSVTQIGHDHENDIFVTGLLCGRCFKVLSVSEQLKKKAGGLVSNLVFYAQSTIAVMSGQKLGDLG